MAAVFCKAWAGNSRSKPDLSLIRTPFGADVLHKRSSRRYDLEPVSVRILYEINAHRRILEADAAHLLVELVRRFNEANNEEAGEHWTPRDVVELMADLVFAPIADQIKDATYSCYDGKTSVSIQTHGRMNPRKVA